jgi:hypothetical protein
MTCFLLYSRCSERQNEVSVRNADLVAAATPAADQSIGPCTSALPSRPPPPAQAKNDKVHPEAPCAPPPSPAEQTKLRRASTLASRLGLAKKRASMIV